MVQPKRFLYTENHKAFDSFPGKRKLQICAKAQMGAYMNIEIANRLVNLRKANNLSQEALAEKLGISRQAVSKWERAEASPDTDNLILLARLYGVSLDELLRTEDEIPMPEEEPEEKEGTSSDDFAREWNSGDINDNTGVHIGKEGIYVQKDGNQVHIDWSGIHVAEEGGDDVRVDWRGVHINEHGKSSFDRSAFDNGGKDDWDGIHIVENGKEVFPGERGWHAEPKLRFPTALIICIAYFVIGIAYKAWHPGWLLLLLIPILESLITAVKRRNASRFAYPVAALLFFLSLGFLYGNWMGWIAFLTIPLYYSLVSFIKDLIRHRRWKKQQKKYQKEETES